MNERFARNLSVRYLDRELHSQRLSCGLTKHVDFEAVLAAAIDLWDANDEWVTAYADYSTFVDANTAAEYRRYPAWERYAPEAVRNLVYAHNDIYSDAPSLGMAGLPHWTDHEHYPLTRWAKEANKSRRAAKRMRVAIAVAKAQIRQSIWAAQTR